ncbi:MAG: hypothetical protein JSV02_01170 [Dehalococcoidia bacterium]|nr:MAG: hypothetical protein JSV02_01170 [Dehalococcoidia bacterium]
MRLFDNRAIAFSVESMTLRILAYSGKKIESWYSVPLSPKSTREGLIVTPEIVGGILSEAIKEYNLPRTGVLCAIPSTGSATQTLTLPDVKGGNLEEVVRREIRRTMPGSQDVDFVYWQKMPRDSLQKQLRVYALAVPRNNILGYADACRAADVKLRGIELRPFALLRAIDCKEGVIVQGELDNVEVVIVEKSFPALYRSIPVKDESPDAEAAGRNLMRELPFTIDYYNRSYPDAQLNPEATIYLSGELALDPKLAMEITEVTGREVVGAETNIDCPPNFPLPQFLTCVGLMLRNKW